MNTSKILFVILPFLLSSAPMKPITKESGTDLLIKFSKEHGLKAIGWKGQDPKKVTPKMESLILKRQGWGGLPSELFFIPENNKNQAQIKTVGSNIKKLNFLGKWQTIDKDKIALWGQTPKGVCSLFVPLEDTHSSLSIVTFPRRRATSRGGFFYIELEKQPGLFFHLSTHHALFNTVETSSLNDANETQRAICQRYYGGKCDVVKSVPEDAYGKMHLLKFPKLEKKSTPCPV